MLIVPMFASHLGLNSCRLDLRHNLENTQTQVNHEFTGGTLHSVNRLSHVVPTSSVLH